MNFACSETIHQKQQVLRSDCLHIFAPEIASLELIPSSGGAFEISVDGRKIYSKLNTGQHPNISAIIKEIESKSS
ncbi:Rdx family protein [Aquibacillus salsiterrae]|uniref:Rdx family protein n=1 Tax=Aquibacillus salsiterrae TaxID=2950439 RepID=UPI003A883AF4